MVCLADFGVGTNELRLVLLVGDLEHRHTMDLVGHSGGEPSYVSSINQAALWWTGRGGIGGNGRVAFLIAVSWGSELVHLAGAAVE